MPSRVCPFCGAALPAGSRASRRIRTNDWWLGHDGHATIDIAIIATGRGGIACHHYSPPAYNEQRRPS